MAYHLTGWCNDGVKYLWDKSSKESKSDIGRLVGNMPVRKSLPPFKSIVLFKKKSKLGVGWGYLYFSEKTPWNLWICHFMDSLCLDISGIVRYSLVCLILQKVLASRWIRKCDKKIIFILRQLKKTSSLSNGYLRWLFQKQTFVEVLQNKVILKNFVEFAEKDLPLFKTPCNLKRRLWHKCFPLNSEIV